MSNLEEREQKANATGPVHGKARSPQAVLAGGRPLGAGLGGYLPSERRKLNKNLEDTSSKSSGSSVNDDESDDASVDERGEGAPREGDRVCYNCGRFGHISRNCPDGNNGKREPRGSRKRDGDRMMQKKFYDEYKEMRGKRDADLERIKDLQRKVKEFEDKPAAHAVPEQDKRLFDRNVDFGADLPAAFDDKPTVRRRFDCRPALFAIALCLYSCMMLFQKFGVFARFNAFVYTIAAHVAAAAVVWWLHRRGMWYEKCAELRYRVMNRDDFVADDDRRDINTRSLPIMLNDPDMIWVRICKLRQTRVLFDLLPSIFPELVECDDPLRNEVVQDVLVSATLFTALRNPRCVVQTADPKRCLERMQRFAESESKINIDRNDEAGHGVRAATVEFAFAYTYGFHVESAEQVSHRFEPPTGSPNWVGPPR